MRVTFTDDAGNAETRTSAATEPVVATGPATGLPIIRGTPIVGQTLTADTSEIKDADGLTSATFTYNWSTISGSLESWVKLSSSDATYTVRAADEDKTVKVAVIFTDDAGNQERLSSTPTELVVGANSPTNNPATGLPTIDGKAQVGGTLTADESGIADADGLDNATFSYQWTRNGGGTDTDTDIPGAVADTYEPDADDEGKTIKVRVTFIDDARNGEVVVSAATEPVAAKANSPATGAPTISGTPEVGQTLTADTSGIVDADGLSNASFSYQWINSEGIVDTDVQGETGDTYDLGADDEGNAIKVRVTFTDDGNNQETLTSGPTAPVQSPDNTPATGTVAISGTAQVGETLTADTSGIADADGLSNPSFSYQWINSDGTTSIYIQSAVAATYTPRHSDEGKTIKVRVTFTDDGGNREALTSAATEAVQYQPNTPATGSVSISGTTQVGEALTAVPSTDIHDEDGTGWYRYQWIVDDGTVDTDVPDETGITYIVRNADAGKTIKVRLSFTDRANYEESFTSEATDAVAPPPPGSFCHRTPQVRDAIVAWVKDNPSSFLLLGLPTNITDCAQVTAAYLPYVTELVLSGSGIDALLAGDFHGLTYLRTLYLNDNNLSELPDGVFDELRFLRRLYLNDNNLSELPGGVFGDLYSLNELDLRGNNLSELPDRVLRGRNGLKELRLDDNPGAPFSFTAELEQWEQAGDDSVIVRVAQGMPFTTEVTLSAQGGALSTETVTVCCGGTVSAVVRVTSDGDEPVTVSVVSVAFNFRPNRSASGIQVGLGDPLTVPEGQDGNNPATGLPAISGTSQVGQTLTADTPGIADADGLTNVSYTYQWIASNRTSTSYIQGATASTYELSDDDVGKTIRVRVSFTDDAENQELLTSEATEAVLAAGASLPNISGTAQVDETLTADVSSIADEDGLTNVSYSYQWIRSDGTNDADIGGQTGSTYTLTDDDVGKIIKVRVSFTDDAGNEETLTSAATGVVAAKPNTPATGAPTIDGTAQVDETLTALTNGITDADGLTNVSYSYQWIRSDNGTDANIAGQTDSTYTLVAADRGKAIKVKVSFTDDADHEETLTSAATGVVAAKPNTPATGAPTIDGTAQVGETLTVLTNGITDADGLTNPTYSYQWLAANVEIAGATNSTYTLSDEDEGKAINVKVSFTDDADHEETLTSAATVVVAAKPNTPAAGASTIDGTAQVDETLTALTNGITDADGLTNVSYSYQWIRSDNGTDADIAGQTASTYTLVFADQGKTIKVRVSFTDDANNAETLTSASTAAVAARPNTPATGAPTIDGTARVGETLTALTNGITDADGLTSPTYSYQWIRSDGNTDADIARETASTYTLSDEDVGKSIKVRVSFADDADNEETLTSAATAAASRSDKPVADEATPVWSADMLVREYTSVSIGAASADLFSNVGGSAGLHIKSLWSYTLNRDLRLAFEEGVPGAADLTLQVGDLKLPFPAGSSGQSSFRWTDVDVDWEDGQTISVRIVPTSATVTPQPNTPATGAPTITGAAQVDETLTADVSSIADSDGLTNVSYSYQWVRNDGTNDADIAGETASTYTPVSADVGKAIKVKVSFTDDAGNEETLTSAATGVVAAKPNTPATGAPTITGAAQVDETLTALTNGITDADGLTNVSYSYQWIRSDNGTDADIAGQTASTYRLVSADVGKTIKVRVSFTDDANNNETLTSAATAAVAARPNSPATGLPTISGTPQVGERLTADTSAIADADGLSNVSFAYQWVAGDANIQHATRSTHILTDDDEGKAIRVKVSFTDDANNAETLTSIATDAVAPRPNTAAAGAPSIQGVLQDGHRITADTVGIVDADGLDDATFAYQWLRVDDGVPSGITGQTASSYALTSDDVGKSIQLQVSFTDDRDNTESLTSAVTGSSTASGSTRKLIWLATIDPKVQDGAITDYTYDSSNDEVILSPDAFTAGDNVQTVTYLGASPGNTIRIAIDLSSQPTTEQTSTWTLMLTDTGLPFRNATYARTTTSPPAHRFQWDVSELASDAATLPEDDEPLFVSIQEAVNLASTGRPTIDGTPQAGETLTADAGNIADGNSLDNVTFQYQWTAGGSDIDEATAPSFTLTSSQEGKTIQVQVYFTDDDGFSETATSEATTAVATGTAVNNPPTGLPTISGTPQVEQTLTADTAGISDQDGLDNVSYSYQWLANGANIDGATGSSYTLTSSEEGDTIQVNVTFTDDAGNEETLTSAATATVAAAPVPLTASILAAPSSHDGDNSFTFELRFSEEVEVSYLTLRDHVFTETGGEVTGASRLDQPSNLRWQIVVEPDSDADVTIVLPPTTDCGAQGAICTGTGKKLSGWVELTVNGPEEQSQERQNNPATGDPAINGTPRVGETLTADTSPIDDADGLTNVSYRYQWTAGGSNISGATGSSHTLTSSEEGQTITVRVTFTDDANNAETLTSAATEAVAAAPAPLTASFQSKPTTHDGQTAFTFELHFSEEFGISYQTLRDHAFTVTGGIVTKAQRLTKGSNIGWTITVTPDSGADVTVVLPVTTDCDADGAVCTADGRKLSNRNEFTVSGPTQ